MNTPKNAVRATSKKIRRIVARIGGREKNGKSEWSLTSPAPIAFFNLNKRIEGVIDKFADKKEIYVYEYPSYSRDDMNEVMTLKALPDKDPKKIEKEVAELFKEKYKRIWNDIQRDFYEVAETRDIRTIVIDTETDLWETRRLAEWGRSASIPTAFSGLNKDMRNMVEAVNYSGKNLIMISEMKKQYKDHIDKNGKNVGIWTGDYEMAGWTGISYKVQVNLLAKFDPLTHTFSTTIIDCGLDQMLAGEVMENDMSTFPFLGITIFPDTTLEDWE